MNVKLLRIIIPVLIISGAAYLLYKINTAPVRGDGEVNSVPRYPLDVDEVLQKFRYNESGEGVLLKLSGDLAVKRGKKVLGFRSTIVKETSIENLAGEWTGQERRVRFTAKSATWGMLKESPLLLREGVTVSVDGVPVKDIDIAKLYLDKREMQIYTDRITVLHIQ